MTNLDRKTFLGLWYRKGFCLKRLTRRTSPAGFDETFWDAETSSHRAFYIDTIDEIPPLEYGIRQLAICNDSLFKGLLRKADLLYLGF